MARLGPCYLKIRNRRAEPGANSLNLFVISPWSGRMSDLIAEVLRVTLIEEIPAAQGGTGQIGIQPQGLIEVEQGSVRFAQHRVGQPAIVKTKCSIWGEHDAGAKGKNRVIISSLLIGTLPPIEVRPKALRLQLEGSLKIGRGGWKVARSKKYPAESVVLPCRAGGGYGFRALRRSRRTPCAVCHSQRH